MANSVAAGDHTVLKFNAATVHLATSRDAAKLTFAAFAIPGIDVRIFFRFHGLTHGRFLRSRLNLIVSQPSGLANDTIETTLQRFRDRMADNRSALSDFGVQRVEEDLADAIQSARQSGYGNKAGFCGASSAKPIER
jgi:hypothetical protein